MSLDVLSVPIFSKQHGLALYSDVQRVIETGMLLALFTNRAVLQLAKYQNKFGETRLTFHLVGLWPHPITKIYPHLFKHVGSLPALLVNIDSNLNIGDSYKG
jgi:hypothetical protein